MIVSLLTDGVLYTFLGLAAFILICVVVSLTNAFADIDDNENNKETHHAH